MSQDAYRKETVRSPASEPGTDTCQRAGHMPLGLFKIDRLGSRTNIRTHGGGRVPPPALSPRWATIGLLTRSSGTGDDAMKGCLASDAKITAGLAEQQI